MNDSKDFLPIYIVMAGVDYTQLGIIREQGFAHYQWIQTKSGSGFLESGDNVMKVGLNQGFLLPPNTPHSYYPSSEGWIQDWVAFDGCMLSQILNVSKLNFFEVYHLQEPSYIASKIKSLLINTMHNLSELERSSIMYGIITSLSKSTVDQVPSCNPNLESALRFINENFKENISIEDIAKSAGISAQYLCSLFKKHLNIKPFEYLTKMRIQKSKDMLLQVPSMKVYEIARLCGFNSVAYFCTTFRRLVGCSPEEFKKMYRV